MFGQACEGPTLSLLPLPPSSTWEPVLPARSGSSVYSKQGNGGFRVGRCGNAGCFLLRGAVGYLLHLAGGGGAAAGHGGRQQTAGVAFVVQVVDELSVFRFLCKHSHQQTDQSVTEQPNKTKTQSGFLRREASASHPTLCRSPTRSPPRSWSCWRPWPGRAPASGRPPPPRPRRGRWAAAGASRARAGRSSLCCSYER